MTDTLIPHILALDTAQEDCGAAILLADGSLFMHVEHVGSRHSERLLPMVRDLIHEAGIEKTDLGLIAFGEGPGSFTGLRVACGAAQGLAWALEVPVAQVSNLEALAEWLRETHLEAARPGTRIAVLNDARMHECYAGMWRVPAAAEDRLERLGGARPSSSGWMVPYWLRPKMLRPIWSVLKQICSAAAVPRCIRRQ